MNMRGRVPPFVTLIIPMRNEERHIAGCLDSVLASDYPHDRVEVLVIDGASTDRSVEIAKGYARDIPGLRVLTNPKRIQAAALNLGLKEAMGGFILRLDAHTVYEPDYVSQCIRLLETTGAANVGGVQRAEGHTYLTRAIALAMNLPFGVGDAKFRYAGREMWVDTAYLGAWRKETLEALGGFREWPVNEDYELNFRLRQAGGRILLSPLVRSRYLVRSSLLGLVWQYFRYGYWKLRSLVAHPDSLRWRQLVPPLFLLALAASVAIAPALWQLSVAVPGLYLLASITVAMRLRATHGLRVALLLPLVFVGMHMSWGVGFLLGMMRWGPPRLSLRTLVRAFKGEH